MPALGSPASRRSPTLREAPALLRCLQLCLRRCLQLEATLSRRLSPRLLRRLPMPALGSPASRRSPTLREAPALLRCLQRCLRLEATRRRR